MFRTCDFVWRALQFNGELVDELVELVGVVQENSGRDRQVEGHQHRVVVAVVNRSVMRHL